MSIISEITQATTGNFGQSGASSFKLGDRGIGPYQEYGLPSAGISKLDEMQKFPGKTIAPEDVERLALEAGASKSASNLVKLFTKYRREVRQSAANVHISALKDREHQLSTTEKIAAAHVQYQQKVTDTRFNIALGANYLGGYQQPVQHAPSLF